MIYIVEHPHRGCLVEVNPACMSGGRFSLLCERSEALAFGSTEEAREAIEQLSPVVAALCDVRQSVDWAVVESGPGASQTVIHVRRPIAG